MSQQKEHSMVNHSFDCEKEIARRVAFIRKTVADAHASGIVFGNSGGKDSALVGILCKMACDNTVGILLPCQSKRNLTVDFKDGREVADKFHIETRAIDLTGLKEQCESLFSTVTRLNEAALTNINPRLRMIALYAVAASENLLVAGTGNASEMYMGYFTKWGDGGHDFNPIADLNVTEVYALLRYLRAPEAIIAKAPSAALYEGQTDEQDMGVTYAAIDHYLETGEADEQDRTVIERYHSRSHHKRRLPPNPSTVDGSNTSNPSTVDGSNTPAPSTVDGSNTPAPSTVDGLNTPAPSTDTTTDN